MVWSQQEALLIMNNHSSIEPDTRFSLIAPGCDDRLIWETWTTKYYLPALAVAIEIGLFPFLATSPRTNDEVAIGLSLGLRGSETLLGLLCSLGFLIQRQGRFCLTDVARTYLLPESPYYCGTFLCTMSQRAITPSMLRQLLEKDRESSSPTRNLVTNAWKSGEISEEIAAAMTPDFHALSFPAAMSMARHGNFSGVCHLLDVAGGSGSSCIALSLRYPDMRFTLMDLPVVCKQTKQYVMQYGLQDQIAIFAANMFTDPWPSGPDGILFSNIFHNWDPDTCLSLAKRSFEALPPGGNIFLQEILLNDTCDGPLVATVFSLMMPPGAKQYTAGELDELLQKAGFVETTILPTTTYYSLISAKKPS